MSLRESLSIAVPSSSAPRSCWTRAEDWYSLATRFRRLFSKSMRLVGSEAPGMMPEKPSIAAPPDLPAR
eukprot:scaffold523_cov237-Pinguiococcus_pyrenoidosus.AAC.4